MKRERWMIWSKGWIDSSWMLDLQSATSRTSNTMDGSTRGLKAESRLSVLGLDGSAVYGVAGTGLVEW